MRIKRSKLGKKLIRLMITGMCVIGILFLAGSAYIYSHEIDETYKNRISEAANTVGALMDADFISELYTLASTDEYMDIYNNKASYENQQPVVDYLKKHEVYDEYMELNDMIDSIRRNMNLEYLYIQVFDDDTATYIIEPSAGCYALGGKEELSEDYDDIKGNVHIDAYVSHSEFGWLISGGEPIYDKRFCQMLHMSHIQFDAWQEMAHCQDEIMEFARKDHPEMKEYNDYREWWTGRHGILGSIDSALSDKRNSIVEAVSIDNYNRAGTIVQAALNEKMFMNDLANMQKEKKDIPFSEWVTSEKTMEYALSSSIAVSSVRDQVEYIHENPEDARALCAKFADGSIVKNTSISFDMANTKATVSGFPSIDELKKVAETERFLEKTDKALNRLENGKYKDKESFIEDSAYAMIGQVYRVNGGKLPDKKDGSSMSLEEYKNMQVQSKAFVDSLKSPEDPNKFISPKKVAATAKNKDKLHDMAKNNTGKKMAPRKEEDCSS